MRKVINARWKRFFSSGCSKNVIVGPTHGSLVLHSVNTRRSLADDMSLDTDDVMSENEWNSAFELAMEESQGSSLDDEELARLEESARPSSTTAATKSGIRKFEDWLQRRGKSCDYASISAVELNDLLRKYYAEVKNYKTGHALSPSSMTGLRAAIHRYITAAPFLRPFNILTDREFVTANNMFNARCKLFYKCGNAKPKHKPSIEVADLKRLGVYFESWQSSPQVLVEAVWFLLCYHFGRRGREGWSSMTNRTFSLECDSEGHSYYTMNVTEATKNHQGGHRQRDQDYSDVRMYGPAVDIFKMYLSRLNEKCDRLFQNPAKSVTPDRWFSAEPMGKNTLSNMMQRISQHAGLSQKYTCHCVRASTITTLFQAGIPTQQIVSITKHKDTKSLGPYISDLSEAQKRGASNTLSNALGITTSTSAEGVSISIIVVINIIIIIIIIIIISVIIIMIIIIVISHYCNYYHHYHCIFL